MIKARTRRIIQGADYSAQEPRVLTQLCEDPSMLQAYMDGKDLYVEIASISFHRPYKFCLEHFPKNCPIKQNSEGKWVYALLKNGQDDGKEKFEDIDYSDINPEDYDYDKLSDGATDVFKEGKEYRGQAKKILLGIMYGRGENSIAEQLGCTPEEAKEIKNSVYDAFPNIKKFERASAQMVREQGYVTTLWGRKRRLPDYNLPTFEFHYLDDSGEIDDSMKVPESDVKKYTEKLTNMWWKSRFSYVNELKTKERILVVDNGNKIANASRQIINSRVQGCLNGSIKVKSKEYGETEIQNHINETLTLWDGEDWTLGTIVESGKKQKCIIYLEDGSQFICSPDHKFRVTTKDGSKVWKKCSELFEDDNIDEDILNDSSM